MGLIRRARVTWAERAVWAGLVLASVAPLVLQPAPEAVARAYVDAVDRGDVDAALDLTSTDFVLRPALGGYYYRREQARLVLEYRAALHERWRVVAWEYDAEDHAAYAAIEITSDVWDRLETRPRIELVLLLRGSQLIVEQPRADARELRRALDPFLAWAAAEYPAELARVWARGTPLHRADSARLLVALLDAWKRGREPLPERESAPARDRPRAPDGRRERDPVAERREGQQP